MVLRFRCATFAFALLLAACGGGGGGGETVIPTEPGAGGASTGGGSSSTVPDPASGAGVTPTPPPTPTPPAPTPAPDPTPAPTPDPAPDPTPEPEPQVPAHPAFEDTLVGTAPVQAGAVAPAVAPLSNGGAVVVWSSGKSLLAQRVASDGSLVGAEMTVASLDNNVLAFAVTSLAGGDWVVTWISQIRPVLTMLAVPYGLQTARFSATGALVQDRQVIVEFTSFDPRVQIKPTSDGGYIIGWASSPSITPPQHVELARFAADGSRTALVGAGNGGTVQSHVQVVPLADGSFVAAWRQAGTAAGAASYTVWTQHFSSALVPLGAPRLLEGSSANVPIPFAVASVGSGRVGVVWLSDPGSDQVSWQVLEASGAAATSVSSQRFTPVVDQLEAVGSDDGFIAFVQVRTVYNRGVNAQLTALSIASDGSLASTSTLAGRSLESISPTTGARSGPAAAGFSVWGTGGGHFAAAYESANGVMRNVFALAR